MVYGYQIWIIAKALVDAQFCDHSASITGHYTNFESYYTT